ncbi:MAG: hypothetical protein P4L84_11895 [Isosphaeraceae bacterium]|nr:hypothetical protein [Isosphaeraceae bacterium]
MRRVQGYLGTTFAAIALAGVPGYGGDGTRAVDRSSTEVKVSGTIKVKGAPMRGGEVTFSPLSAGRVTGGGKAAKVNNDGTYEVTTFVGHNDVRISGPALKKEPMLGYATKSIDVPSAGGPVDLEFP